MEVSWDKDPNESVYECLLRKRCNKDWLRCYAKKVKNNPQNYDITLMHDLLPRISSTINIYDTETGDPTSLESTIQKVKDLRDKVYHERKSSTSCLKTFSEIIEVASMLVNQICQRFNVSKVDAEKKKNWVQELIVKVQETTQSTDEKKISAIASLIKTDCAAEQNKRWGEALEREYLPFSKTEVPRVAVFHNPAIDILSDKTRLRNFGHGHGAKIDSFNIILQVSSEIDNRIAIIIGPPGSGKSSLINRITLEHCKKLNDPKFPSLGSYEHLIYISCRDRTYSTFIEYLNGFYSKTINNHEIEVNDVLRAIQGLKLIVLIDGLDELNYRSRTLVKDVIEKLKWKETTTFVITSRSASDLEIRRQFEIDGIDYVVFSLRSIDDPVTQVEFIEKYQKAIPELQSEKLIEVFKKHQSRFSTHFNLPLNLVLFCHLFNELPTEVEKMTHEGHFMEYTIIMCQHKIKNRIESNTVAGDNNMNASNVAAEIVYTVCEFSFFCLHRNILEIDEEYFDELQNRCWDINSDIPVKSCLSCILQERKSFYLSRDIRHVYIHKSQQEFLASKALVTQLEKRRSGSLCEVLEYLARDKVRKDEFKRYYHFCCVLKGHYRIKA